MTDLLASHRRDSEEFLRAARSRGLHEPGLELFFWYHCVDLGGGLVTPGAYDYRPTFPLFGFPSSLSGARVLDVGAATGFFSFELERRGGEVTALEVPSIEALDRFPGEPPGTTRRKLSRMLPGHSPLSPADLDRLLSADDEEFHRLFLDGPFLFCRRALGSRVERRYASIHDLSARTVGRTDFDLVFLGDVLLHTFRPFDALAAAASVCAGTLFLSQGFPDTGDAGPAVLWTGGETPGSDAMTWWLPNQACVEQVLRKLGFREVELVGVHDGAIRPSGARYRSGVIRASR